jgi:iron complex outermembrane recepter protein
MHSTVLSIFRFLQFTLLLICVEPLIAQKLCDCSLRGKVTNTENPEPIVGALVYLKGTKMAVYTDAQGQYQFNKLCSGKHTLVSRLLGYQETEITVQLTHTIEQDITLKNQDIHLQDVSIKAEKVTQLSLKQESLQDKQLFQTQGKTLGDALQSFTGVVALQTGSSIVKPVIHGFHSNRVLILNNGIRQEGQQWGAEHAPEIDPFVANKITVVKGVASMRYGSDAIGGVILVEPAVLPTVQRLKAEVNLMGFSNGQQGVVSTRWENTFGKANQWAWRLQGTAKRGADVHTANYYLQNTGIAEINYSATLGYQTKKGLASELYFSLFNTQLGIFTGSHIGSTTDLQDAIIRSTPLAIYTPEKPSYNIDRPYQDVTHYLLKLKSKRQTAKGNIWQATLARQYNYRAEYDVTRLNQGVSQAFQLISYTGELTFAHRPFTALKLTGMGGINGVYQQNISTGTLNAPKTLAVLIPNYENWAYGTFWTERMVRTHWEGEIGIRYDQRNLTVFRKKTAIASNTDVLTDASQQQHFTAMLGGVYHWGKQWTTQANLSTAWRPASVHELFANGVHHGAAAYEEGNANLQSENAYQASLNILYQTPKLAVEAHAFHYLIRNYLYLQPQDSLRLTVRGAFPLFKYVQTDAIFSGLDLSLHYRINNYFSFISKWAYLYAKDLSHQTFMVNIPANRWENTFKFERANYFASIGYLYVAQQKNVAPNSDFALPPAAYSLTNLQAGTSYKQLSISIGISNLFNIAYREYLNRQRYFADDLGRNIALRLKINL